MRIAFMGTPDFAVPALEALLEAGHDVVCVYTQPPRPAGRGYDLKKSPVHLLAENRGIPVRTPKSLRKSQEEQDAFAALNLDVAVIAAYGLILPQAVLDAPRMGCINIHGSLLPRWRGAAPLQRAMLAGDPETGITIMQMDAGLDTGGMLLREATPIHADTTASELHDRMAEMGARLIVQTLSRLPMAATPQPSEGITYAEKITKEDGRLDFTKDAESLLRQVNALNPWPGTFFAEHAETIKVLQAETMTPDSSEAPGTLLDDQFTIACERGALRLLTVQRAGKAATDGASFLRGYPLQPGDILA
ncbi:MAG: methionyl-tRNA formyltransferase [Alphaproteobacteria bacterium GWF2_58_20]|nr:MAG: methionyl-tRNA formyltransferase [Alphaproteobacteria bacterium GWF2_58_20]